MKIRHQLLAFLSIPALALALAAAVPQDKKPPLPGGDYKIDAVHSAVLFKIKHLNTSWQFGRFNTMEGTFSIDPAKLDAAKVDITIQTDSLDTNNKKRDEDVMGPNLFDVKQFPTATFKSKSVAKKGDDVYTVTGDLMIHGVTKSVAIDMEYTGSSEAMGKRVGFFGTLDIKRTDFGMKAMTDALSDEVQLTLTFEGTGGKGKSK